MKLPSKFHAAVNHITFVSSLLSPRFPGPVRLAAPQRLLFLELFLSPLQWGATRSTLPSFEFVPHLFSFVLLPYSILPVLPSSRMLSSWCAGRDCIRWTSALFIFEHCWRYFSAFTVSTRMLYWLCGSLNCVAQRSCFGFGLECAAQASPVPIRGASALFIWASVELVFRFSPLPCLCFRDCLPLRILYCYCGSLNYVAQRSSFGFGLNCVAQVSLESIRGASALSICPSVELVFSFSRFRVSLWDFFENICIACAVGWIS